MLLKDGIELGSGSNCTYTLYPLDKPLFDKLDTMLTDLKKAYDDKSKIDFITVKDKFVREVGFDPVTEVHMIGLSKLSEYDVVTIERLFKVSTQTNPTTMGKTFSYPCWCAKFFRLETVPKHRTVMQSWDCLMQCLNNPEAVIVLRSYKVKQDLGVNANNMPLLPEPTMKDILQQEVIDGHGMVNHPGRITKAINELEKQGLI